MPRFAARLHVLLARDAPIGLVIRRGPSKQCATILWDRQSDRFTLGQWLKGRIYERRSDLSPDGKHFIYFAMNGKWTSEARGAWTAISRTPYLKAVAMFAKGDCWNGGGLWTSNTRYWLNDGYGHATLLQTAEVRRDAKFQPAESRGGECPGVYYPRLVRDGWVHKQRDDLGKWKTRDIFERRIGSGWTLRKVAHAEIDHPKGKGCYWDEHELVDGQSNATAFPQWEWAEVDGKRLVWAAGGKLMSAQLRGDRLSDPSELYDFNHLSFTPVEAPY